MQFAPEERYYMKLKASYLYYKEKRSFAEIVDILHISRPTLTKLLKEAEDEGIVKIEITDVRRAGLFTELEQSLCKKLGLTDARIIRVGLDSQEAVNRSIGAAAAAYLSNLLKKDMTIGIGWGQTLQNLTNNLRPDPSVTNLHIVSLLGGLSNADIESYTMFANTLSRDIASNFAGSTLSMLYTPLIAQDDTIAAALKASESIAEVFSRMKHMDVAIVGIDSDIEHSTTIKMDKAFQNVFGELREKKAVGNMCAHFYDINGKYNILSIENRIIAVPAEELKNTPIVIGAAGGRHKIPSIIGGARACLYNVLITDEYTAKALDSSPLLNA